MQPDPRNLRAYALAVFVALVGSLVVRSTSLSSEVRQDTEESAVRARQHTAARAQGVRAAAAIGGRFIGEDFYPNVGGPANLPELVGLSEVIVTAVSVSNIARVTADGRSIVTLHRMRVDEMLKGILAEKSDFTLVLRGGRVTFPDGTTARLVVPGMQPIATGRLVSLFLRRAPDALIRGIERFERKGPTYLPVAGPLGIFHMSQPAGVFIQPSGFPTSLLTRTIVDERLGPLAFVDHIRSLVATERVQ